MVNDKFLDSGSVRSWLGINNERVALLLYGESLPLEKSALTLTSSGGVCVFSSPPLYDDPEVIIVKNWSREVSQLVERQGFRHAFIGGIEKAAILGASPKYADI
jgi:hypothetical protein